MKGTTDYSQMERPVVDGKKQPRVKHKAKLKITRVQEDDHMPLLVSEARRVWPVSVSEYCSPFLSEKEILKLYPIDKRKR